MRTWIALGLLGCVSCVASPPPRWTEGGARLQIEPSVWIRENGDQLHLEADGDVMLDGDRVLFVDVVGRVADEYREPLAVLQPDGDVLGANKAYLGKVAAVEAAPPDRGSAWVRILDDGRVQYIDDEGKTEWGGRWKGCKGLVKRTCTLVTHMLRVVDYKKNVDAAKRAKDSGAYD